MNKKGRIQAMEAEREQLRRMILEDPQTMSDAAFSRRERELLVGPDDNDCDCEWCKAQGR